MARVSPLHRQTAAPSRVVPGTAPGHGPDVAMRQAQAAYRFRMAELAARPQRRHLREYLDLCELMALLDESAGHRDMRLQTTRWQLWQGIVRFRAGAAWRGALDRMARFVDGR